MDKLFVLFKATAVDNYNINKWFLKNDKTPKGILKKVASLLLIVIILGYLMGIVSLYTKMGIDYLAKYNLEYLVISIFLGVTFFSLFTMSIFKSKATIFNSKDTDMLFSMPIKPSTILTNKLINLLLINYLTTLMIMVPVIITYGVILNCTLTYYIYSFISLIFLPFIPTILSAIFGYLIAILTTKTKGKNIIEIIFTFGIIFFFMLSSSFIQKIAEMLVQNVDKFNNILKTFLFPIYVLQKAVLELDLKSLLLFILVSILSFMVFVVLLNKLYMKISMKLQENSSKGKYVDKKLKTSSISFALLKKELKTYFSTPIYVINTGFGTVMLVFLTIASFFYSVDDILSKMQIQDLKDNVYLMFLVAFGFITAMTNTTSSSISLEGENISLIKSLPIKEMDIFKSKIKVNLLVILPVSILSAIILGFKIGLDAYHILSLIIFITTMALMVSQFGIITNLLFPKLKFKSPVQVVKQGLSPFVAMMGMLCLCGLIVMAYYFTSDFIGTNTFSILVILLFVILIFVQHLIITKWGVQRFKKL